MKKRKLVLALMLSLMMLVTMIPSFSFADGTSGTGSGAASGTISAATSGTCGATGHESDVTWSFDESSGTLTISGNGAMADYTKNITSSDADQPWKAYTNEIKQVCIKNGVTRIGAFAFNGLGTVESYQIAGSVATVGEWAIDSTAVNNFDVDSNSKGLTVVDGALLTKDQKELLAFPCGNESIKKYTLPQETKTISAGAFSGASHLEAIDLTNVETIGSLAFMNAGIKKLEIPETANTVMNWAFAGCSSMEKVTIDSSNLKLGDNAVFPGCTALKSFKISENGNVVLTGNPFRGSGAYKAVTSLEVADLIGKISGNGVKTFFAAQNNLKTVNADGTNAGLLTAANFPNVETINITGENASLIPWGFANNTSLKNVNIDVEGNVNNSSNGLEGVFRRALGLENVTIKAAGVTFDKKAFVECKSLKIVDLKECKNITYAESCFNTNASSGYTSINKDFVIYVSDNNQIPKAVTGVTTGNGIVISTNGGSFSEYPANPNSEFPMAKKSGYSLIRWYIEGSWDNETKSQVTATSIKTGEKYVAEWEEKAHSTITLNSVDNKTYDGNPIELTADNFTVTGSTGAITFVYQQKDGDHWTDLDAAPVNVGEYRVKATVAEDDTHASAVSDYVKFEIQKASPAYSVPQNLTATEGQTLADVTLPEGFAWDADETTPVGAPGTHELSVTYTPADTNNYNVVEGIKVKLTVYMKWVDLNQVPVINAEDKTLTVGDSFDPMDGVTASDAEDGDLTNKIEIAGNTVDTSKAGLYSVTYKVSDKDGASVEKSINVVVKEKTAPPTTVSQDGSVNGSKTGDTMPIGMLAVLMLAAAAGIAFCGRKLYKSR